MERLLTNLLKRLLVGCLISYITSNYLFLEVKSFSEDDVWVLVRALRGEGWLHRER